MYLLYSLVLATHARYDAFQVDLVLSTITVYTLHSTSSATNFMLFPELMPTAITRFTFWLSQQLTGLVSTVDPRITGHPSQPLALHVTVYCMSFNICTGVHFHDFMKTLPTIHNLFTPVSTSCA